MNCLKIWKNRHGIIQGQAGRRGKKAPETGNQETPKATEAEYKEVKE